MERNPALSASRPQLEPLCTIGNSRSFRFEGPFQFVVGPRDLHLSQIQSLVQDALGKYDHTLPASWIIFDFLSFVVFQRLN